ncbi:MAG: hypothetical protein J6U54_21470 [Clostridiales bacterium]|nr:hypothetical protein [Clostridiales bacterium]
MKRKKLLAIIMVAAVSLTAFSGCNKTEKDEDFDEETVETTLDEEDEEDVFDEEEESKETEDEFAFLMEYKDDDYSFYKATAEMLVSDKDKFLWLGYGKDKWLNPVLIARDETDGIIAYKNDHGKLVEWDIPDLEYYSDSLMPSEIFFDYPALTDFLTFYCGDGYIDPDKYMGKMQDGEYEACAYAVSNDCEYLYATVGTRIEYKISLAEYSELKAGDEFKADPMYTYEIEEVDENGLQIGDGQYFEVIVDGDDVYLSLRDEYGYLYRDVIFKRIPVADDFKADIVIHPYGDPYSSVDKGHDMTLFEVLELIGEYNDVFDYTKSTGGYGSEAGWNINSLVIENGECVYADFDEVDY